MLSLVYKTGFVKRTGPPALSMNLINAPIQRINFIASEDRHNLQIKDVFTRGYYDEFTGTETCKSLFIVDQVIMSVCRRGKIFH